MLATVIQVQPQFDIDDKPEPELDKLPKYDWNIVLNHASPEVLKLSARNPWQHEPTLKGISSNKEMTCRAFLQGKVACIPHKRTTNNWRVGE